MTPSEAYQHLQRTLEQVNAVTGELFTSDVLAKSSEVTIVLLEFSHSLGICSKEEKPRVGPGNCRSISWPDGVKGT